MKSVAIQVLCLTLVLVNYGSSLFGRDLSEVKSSSYTAAKLESKANLVDPFLIDWPTFNGVHQTGKIMASFNCFGTFGGNYSAELITPEWPGVSNSTGFVTPQDSAIEYLYGGAIWIGGIVGDDTLVSVGFDGWQSNQEFSPPLYNLPNPSGSVNKVDFIADFSMRAVFTDTAGWRGSYSSYDPLLHRPLNLKIASRSHAWHAPQLNKVILYDLVITNVGQEHISEGYIGLYFDCDVGIGPEYYTDDLTGSLHDRGIGYIIDNDGDIGGATPDPTKIFAFKYLDNSFSAKDTNYNWWIGNVNPNFDFGPRQRGTPEFPLRDFGTGGFGTPEGDRNKYYIMRFREWDYDQVYTYSIGDTDAVWLPPNIFNADDFSVGFDTRFLMSIGPFELAPDSSIRVLFSTFTGDFVHSTPGAANYLPEDPATYLSFLYFEDVYSNAAKADNFAQLILNPQLPPLGLELIRNTSDSFELQWDPWVFDGYTGYFLYLSEANLESLPHPGAIPPWWMPDTTVLPVQIGKTYKLEIDSLDPNKIYLASIAHSIGNVRGQLGSPINFRLNSSDTPPEIPSRHAFANPGGPLTLKWNPSVDKLDIHHFNIYKFPSKQAALSGYHPFYDEGHFAGVVTPVDSFHVGNNTYFYYAMEPYTIAGPNDSVFLDFDFAEGNAYLIASSDQFGFESEFTEPIIANIVDEMTRDILIITHSVVTTPNNFAHMDSIYSFYNRLLQGYDYDIYVHRDSTHISVCPTGSVTCMDWHDFMKFKMVIVDDHLTESFFSKQYQDETDGFVRYLSYGGKLVYFGRFRGFGFMNQHGTLLNYAQINNEFVNDFLGIDSILIGGERYYFTYAVPPQVDTLFGFIQALSVDTLIPTIDADTIRDPFTPRLRTLWTPHTPPGVATFKINENANTTALFKSVYPTQSVQEDGIVGLRRDFPALNTSAFTFGFHLWYMDSTDARNLIESIFNDAPSVLSGQSHIEPSFFRLIQANTIEPLYADIFLGNLAHNRNVGEIDQASILINSTVAPFTTEVLPFVNGYNGDVLKIEVALSEFLRTYIPVWDTLVGNYTVDAGFSDGLSLQATGDIVISGHRRGDINSDDAVNIFDLTLLVDHLFRGRRLPLPNEPADLDSNETVNILDLTRLIDYIFRNENL